MMEHIPRELWEKKVEIDNEVGGRQTPGSNFAPADLADNDKKAYLHRCDRSKVPTRRTKGLRVV